jgi:hypothetical protein
MESTEAVTVQEKLPKNSKGNRYYYKNREAILEKKRIARLAKKGIDSPDATTPQLSLEERRKIKMEFLGILNTKE